MHQLHVYEKNLVFKKGRLMVLSQILTKSEQWGALLWEQTKNQVVLWVIVSCWALSLPLGSHSSPCSLQARCTDHVLFSWMGKTAVAWFFFCSSSVLFPAQGRKMTSNTNLFCYRDWEIRGLRPVFPFPVSQTGHQPGHKPACISLYFYCITNALNSKLQLSLL